MHESLFHFGTLDWVIVAVIALSIIVSFFRGFLREAISLATWLFAFFAAIKFSPLLDNMMKTSITHNMTRYMVSIISIFVVVLIIGMIINKIAHSIVSKAGVGFVDRTLGVLFGAARGILFVVIILLVVTQSPYQTAEGYKQSVLAPYFHGPVTYFVSLLPKDIKSFSTWIDRFNAARETYHHPLSN